MSVVKIVELVGCSDKSWQEAADNAVNRAAETIRNIRGVDVLGWTGKVKDDKIVEYLANVKISFVVEEVRV
jgi:flavin-binding protein dodecin